MHIFAILSLKITYSYLMKQHVWLALKSLVLFFGALSSCSMSNTCIVQRYCSEMQILGGGVTWSKQM